MSKPKLPNYDLAPITPEAFTRLSPYFAKAPSWATHVGSDSYGVHFFDHQPYVFPQRHRCAFVKGILPNTHRSKCSVSVDATEILQVVVVEHVPVIVEPTIAELKVELAAVKAKLWEAEWKLNKITSIVEDGIL